MQLYDRNHRLPPPSLNGLARARLGHAVLRLLAASTLLAAASLGVPSIDLLCAQTSEGDVNREYPLKAAYLYNFASYVEWPASAFSTANAPFTIGVLGTDPFGAALDEVASTKKVFDRRIVVTRFASAKQITPCQLLFISASVSKSQRAEAIVKIGRAPVLIVTDSGTESAQGEIIHFVTENNRIRFTVNAGLAKKLDLKISSKVLALAKTVSTN